MKKSYKKYDIDINVLTPVHIGFGETYDAKEYFYSVNYVERVNLIKFYSSLSNSNKRKFLGYMQKKTFSLNDFSLEKINLKVNDLNFDESYFKDFSRYSLVNKTLTPPKPNSNIEAAVNSFNKLYIPGSSLKGVIKTALLFNSIKLDENNIPNILGGNNKDFINSFFSSDISNPIQTSIMRFLHVSDSTFLEGNAYFQEVLRWKITDNKKYPITKDKDGKRYLETIPQTQNPLKTSILINFDKDFYDDLKMSESLINKLDIKEIANSLAVYSKCIIDYEIDFFKKYHMSNVVNFYEDLLDCNRCNKPLIQVGMGLGIYTKTIYLKFKEYDKVNGTNFSKIYEKIFFNVGVNSKFPKVKTLTKFDYQPLGWVQLDFSNYVNGN